MFVHLNFIKHPCFGLDTLQCRSKFGIWLF